MERKSLPPDCRRAVESSPPAAAQNRGLIAANDLAPLPRYLAANRGTTDVEVCSGNSKAVRPAIPRHHRPAAASIRSHRSRNLGLLSARPLPTHKLTPPLQCSRRCAPAHGPLLYYHPRPRSAAAIGRQILQLQRGLLPTFR